MLGYGQFNISTEKYKKKCQGCGKNVRGDNFRNIGFRNAKIVIDGVMIVGGEEVIVLQ
jgi:hypothetical protein